MHNRNLRHKSALRPERSNFPIQSSIRKYQLRPRIPPLSGARGKIVTLFSYASQLLIK